MGDDDIKTEDEELTAEELAITGESEEETETEETEESETEEAKKEESEEEETETKETEETEEEAKETETETKIPQSRLDEVVSDRKVVEHKLDLLKTDPDKYYEKYPDEKPAAKDDKPKVSDGEDADIYAMTVDGGEHHGKTVREVSKEDPGAAVELITKHYRQADLDQRDADKAEAKKVADEDAQKQRDLEETDAFLNARAEEVHGKKLSELSKEDQAKIEEIGTKTWEWQKDNDATHYSWNHAYALMTIGDAKAQASSDGANKIISKITKPAVASISSSKDAGRETGYEADLAMTADQLADKIEDMSEPKFLKWKKDAPKELRDKHPSIDWG